MPVDVGLRYRLPAHNVQACFPRGAKNRWTEICFAVFEVIDFIFSATANGGFHGLIYKARIQLFFLAVSKLGFSQRWAFVLCEFSLPILIDSVRMRSCFLLAVWDAD